MLRLFLDTPKLLALATPLPVPSLLRSPVLIAYHGERHADFKLAGYMLIAAITMTWIGATVTSYLDGRVLMVLTAFCIMFVAVTSLYRAFRKTKPEHGVEVEHIFFFAMASALSRIFCRVACYRGGYLQYPAI